MTGAALRIESLTGDAARAVFDDLARLRITVFRDWPYLYDGDEDYERRYLATYAESAGGVVVAAFDGDRVVVAAFDGDRVVGAATGLPLADEPAHVSAPFRAVGIDPAQVFYMGESVLLKDYRGRGVGHAFFEGREARARALGLTVCAFCAVMRPDDHPLRPPDARPLDPFWRARGYEARPDMVTSFSWKDIGAAEETPKPMRFWLRTLAS